MPRKSQKRLDAEAVLNDPTASDLAKREAELVIARLNKRAAYQSQYEKRRRKADPEYAASRRSSKAEWKQRNPGKVYQSVKRHREKRYNEDPKFRIDSLIRSVMNRGLRNAQMTSSYYENLDWDFGTLKKHIESQFTPEMSWENWGDVWEIDHAIPRASFDYTSMDDSEFIRCWSLNNLKPTLKAENREQGYELSNRPKT